MKLLKKIFSKTTRPYALIFGIKGHIDWFNKFTQKFLGDRVQKLFRLSYPWFSTCASGVERGSTVTF